MSRITPVLRSSVLASRSLHLRGTARLPGRVLPKTQTAYNAVRCLATPAAMPNATKENIGVFCNPEHKLWVEPSGPTVKDVRSGEGLKEGEVTIAIKSTGICG